MKTDLLVVGCGELGTRVAVLWKKSHPDAYVQVVTATLKRHDKLRQLGLTPVLELSQEDSNRFAHVLFCIPPSNCAEYAQLISNSLDLYSGTGSYVFISSTGVYEELDGETIDDFDPSLHLSCSSRAKQLLAYETLVQETNEKQNIHVVRAAGLYDLNRGPHNVYLGMEAVARRGDGYINLIHYDDLADLVVLVLKHRPLVPYHCRVFVACDNNPVTREGMMASVYKFMHLFDGNHSVNGPRNPIKFGVAASNASLPNRHGCAVEASDVKGKILKNPATRKCLVWEPKYSSFECFLEKMSSLQTKNGL
eukprot:Sdes_comp22879_c0_seq1m21253